MLSTAEPSPDPPSRFLSCKALEFFSSLCKVILIIVLIFLKKKKDKTLPYQFIYYPQSFCLYARSPSL